MADTLRLFIVDARATDGRKCQFVALAETAAQAETLVRQEYYTNASTAGGPWTIVAFVYHARVLVLR